MSVTYLCKFMASEKKKTNSIMLAALIAHHKPTSTSYNGISYINMKFLADQYPLFWELMYALR